MAAVPLPWCRSKSRMSTFRGEGGGGACARTQAVRRVWKQKQRHRGAKGQRGRQVAAWATWGRRTRGTQGAEPHLGQAVGALCMPRRQRHVVEQAVTKRGVGRGMVPRRAGDAEGGGAARRDRVHQR
jgi:hypothetical protein